MRVTDGNLYKRWPTGLKIEVTTKLYRAIQLEKKVICIYCSLLEFRVYFFFFFWLFLKCSMLDCYNRTSSVLISYTQLFHLVKSVKLRKLVMKLKLSVTSSFYCDCSMLMLFKSDLANTLLSPVKVIPHMRRRKGEMKISSKSKWRMGGCCAQKRSLD